MGRASAAGPRIGGEPVRHSARTATTAVCCCAATRASASRPWFSAHRSSRRAGLASVAVNRRRGGGAGDRARRASPVRPGRLCRARHAASSRRSWPSMSQSMAAIHPTAGHRP